MAKSRSSRSNTSGNGGILGSGVFGLFGSTIQCDSETNSLYCNFVKIFNVLIMILVIFGIIYFVFSFFAGSGQRGGAVVQAFHKLFT